MFQNSGGIQSLLKEGGRHYAGMDEALLKNIEAAKQVGEMTRSSFGPYGLNKLVVNHLEKQFITRDAAVILEETDIVHPAAKLVVMAAKSQEQECGDATNLVTVFSGELLSNAEELLKQGIHASDVVRGYELAIAGVVEEMKTKSILTMTDLRNREQLEKVLRPVLATKQYGQEHFLAQLVAEACISIMPEKLSEFNSDNVRVASMTGSGIFTNSHVVSGVVCPRDTMGNEGKKLKAKVAVYSIGLENAGPETNGTVLLNNAADLMNFTKGEEGRMEEFVKSLVNCNIDAVITGGSIQDIALHFLNKYKILVIKCTSKFELRRLCDTIGATAINRMGPPLPEETGYAESIEVVEISNHKVTVVQAGNNTKVSTVVLRGATANMLAEVERSIVDAVNVVRCMCVKNEVAFCAGGGACELEVAVAIHKLADSYPGLEQYGIHKVAEALEVVPKILARNSGLDADETLAALNAAHRSKNQPHACVNVDAQGKAVNAVTDAIKAGVYDHLGSKIWALRLAMDAVLTVLRIQHIIVAKQAGGPRAPRGEGVVDDD
jgi:T-complex protein 1 subunit theta